MTKGRRPARRISRGHVLFAVGLIVMVSAIVVLSLAEARDDRRLGASAPATTAAEGTPEPSPAVSRSPDGRPSPSPSATPPKSGSPLAGFPSAANTGWRHTGVTLRSYQGPLTISKANTVIDGVDIRGCVTVRAANVTIKRSRIACSGIYPLQVSGAGSLLVEDTELDGQGSPGANCLGYENFTARRVDCHGVGDGMRLGDDVVIEDSYIHDLVTCGGCHNDGVQAVGGSNMVLRHNTIENKYGQTSAIKLGAELGPLHNVLVENNLLSGGGYTIYAGGSGDDVSGIQVINNRFRRSPAGFFPKGGSYGPVSYYDPNLPGNRWSGNVWDDTGAAIRG